MSAAVAASAVALLHEEAVALTAELIRIDSTSTDDPALTGDGESRCAQVIRARLAEVGLEGGWYERTSGRGNLVVRIPGTRPDVPALLLHAHTDVVPAGPGDWSADPFGGEIRDGCLWGRGAVDMKNMIGMLVAAVRDLRRSGWSPRRDIVLAFVADEEVSGEFGMGFLVDEHPEVFAGVTEAVGEVGGFSFETPVGRRYAIGIGEKAITWATLRARGAEGHGSLTPNSRSAIARLTTALARVVAHEWPAADDRASRTVRQHLGSCLGIEIDPQHPEADLAPLGAVAPMFGTAFRASAVPTQVHAGSKTNTVPGTAMATIDCRIPVGQEEQFHRTLAELIGPGIEVSWNAAPGVTAEYGTSLTDAMRDAIGAVDPEASVVPFLTGGATDAKSLMRLGIACYGFTPLRLPDRFDYPAMFHGVDERVPLSALHSGAEILRQLLLSR